MLIFGLLGADCKYFGKNEQVGRSKNHTDEQQLLDLKNGREPRYHNRCERKIFWVKSDRIKSGKSHMQVLSISKKENFQLEYCILSNLFYTPRNIATFLLTVKVTFYYCYYTGMRILLTYYQINV